MHVREGTQQPERLIRRKERQRGVPQTDGPATRERTPPPRAAVATPGSASGDPSASEPCA